MAFDGSSAAHFGICTAAQSFGKGSANLKFYRHRAAFQGLRISIADNELNILYTHPEHVVDSIAAPAANTNDFDIAKDAVPFEQLIEIDRYALSRAAELQAEIVGAYNATVGVFEGGHFGQYEFHPVVSKLQLYCSEDLGAFYLDVLKDRLYTTATGSLSRRSAQTALYAITQAMLRWMAPFLSFTAEEAWGVMGTSPSIFLETYSHLSVPNTALVAKWRTIQDVRELANKEIESKRSAGLIGASLQAELTITCDGATFDALASLGDDVKFVFITSKVQLIRKAGDLHIDVKASEAVKCERCWHYSEDIGRDAAHPTLCGRCTSNVFGSGEVRHFA